MNELRKVLEELVQDIQGGALTSWSKEKVDEAEFSIHSLYMGCVGEDKQGITFHGGRQLTEKGAYSPTDNQKIGYNAALADVRDNMEKVREG